MLATGDITAVIGSPTNFTNSDPRPRVQSRPARVEHRRRQLAFFFVEGPGHLCAGGAVTTGAVPPYPATRKQSGKNLVVNVPIPTYVTQPLGLAGSLLTEHLKWFNLTTKVNGKKVGVLQSIGCKSGKRPFSVPFNATLPPANTTETSTVSGKQTCRSSPDALRCLLRRRVETPGLRAAPSFHRAAQATVKRSARWASRSDSRSICTNTHTSAIPITIDCSRAITRPAID